MNGCTVRPRAASAAHNPKVTVVLPLRPWGAAMTRRGREVNSAGGLEGWLAGSFTTLDEKESKPWAPIPKRQRPVPVPKGERIKYGIYLGPLAHNVRKDHSIEVIIRTTDDMYSRLAAATIFFMPRMVDLTANIHHGLDSYLLLPIREL